MCPGRPGAGIDFEGLVLTMFGPSPAPTPVRPFPFLAARPRTMARPDTVLILAAGQGTRMKTGWAKVMAPLCGRPMIAWVVDQALALDPKKIVVVVGYRSEEVERAVRDLDPRGRIRCVLQSEQRGTGHAVQCCLPELVGAAGQVVLLYGDMPLLSRESLERLCAEQEASSGGMALLTAIPTETRGFGRIVRGEDGTVARIVEEKDASPAEKAIREVNLGVYAFDGEFLVGALPKLQSDNAQNELYVTDVVAQFSTAGRKAVPVALDDEREAIGVNTLAHLSEARAALQDRILLRHLESGVVIEDPATTYIDHGVEIGPRTRILPASVIRSGVRIGSDCEVGPFAHLRSGTVLEDGAEVGNFVEVKNTRLGPHSKAKHLSYLGDGQVGGRVNIGAGTIFANYDGKAKHVTTVGERAFVGSGTVLVAPCKVGDGATTGAGAVVTRGSEVPPGDVWVGVPARPIESRRGAKSQGRGQ
jgi:bifunctional UDP-N-acetylglucosamine pyrophosphorylase / glucosamine-1-phosphate N-acetyltransferase